MTAKHIAKGDSLVVTAGADKVAGQLEIMAGAVGIWNEAAASGAKGVVILEGIYRVPKLTGATESFALGAKVYAKATGTGKATAGVTGMTLMGVAAAAAATGDTEVDVKLTPGVA